MNRQEWAYVVKSIILVLAMFGCFIYAIVADCVEDEQIVTTNQCASVSFHKYGQYSALIKKDTNTYVREYFHGSDNVEYHFDVKNGQPLWFTVVNSKKKTGRLETVKIDFHLNSPSDIMGVEQTK